MRKVWSLALAPLLALAVVTVGSGPANAFGGEALGCAVGASTFTYDYCSPSSPATSYTVGFRVDNRSGTYSYSWSVVNSYGGGTMSIVSGCTSVDYGCTVRVYTRSFADQTITATVTLTQAGQSRTLEAYADVPAVCPNLSWC